MAASCSCSFPSATNQLSTSKTAMVHALFGRGSEFAAVGLKNLAQPGVRIGHFRRQPNRACDSHSENIPPAKLLHVGDHIAERVRLLFFFLRLPALVFLFRLFRFLPLGWRTTRPPHLARLLRR